MNTRFTNGLLLIGVAVTAPTWAVSLAITSPAQALPENRAASSALVEGENWSAGSAALVPLMAAEMQASHLSHVDAPADAAGGSVGKPIDDMAFLRKATESGRKEVIAAREALPQLKTPELRHVAEMLVIDHSNANARLASIAEAKGWPVAAPQAAAAPPTGSAVPDFDAKWTAEMIAGHERSVALYRAQAAGGEDKDLRKYARDTLPTIEHHLAELRSLQK